MPDNSAIKIYITIYLFFCSHYFFHEKFYTQIFLFINILLIFVNSYQDFTIYGTIFIIYINFLLHYYCHFISAPNNCKFLFSARLCPLLSSSLQTFYPDPAPDNIAYALQCSFLPTVFLPLFLPLLGFSPR